MVHAVTPAFFQSMDYGDYMFGVAFACMSLTNFLFSPFWGVASGRLGHIRCFVFGILGYTAAQVFFALARAEFTTVLARLLSGMFVSSFSISAVLYVSDLAGDEKRGKYVAYLAAVQTASAAAGYFFGGLLGTVSVHTAFIGQAAVCLAAALLAAVLVRGGTAKAPAGEPRRFPNPFRSFIDMRSIMNGFLLVFLCATFCSSFTTYCFDNSFNYFIRDQFAFPTSYNGTIKAVVGIIGMLANFFINPLLIRKGDPRRSIIAVFGAGAAALAVLSLMDTVIVFVLIAVLYYTANAIYLPIQQTLGAGKGDGRVYGAFMSIRSLGQMAGGLIAGLLYTVGQRAPFYASAAGFLLAMVFSAVNYRQSRMQCPKETN